MKKLTMFIVLLAGAMTVQARISETKEQILKRFGGWEAVSSVYTLNGQDVMMFRHKNVAYIYFNSNGQSELEIYHLSTRFNKSDAYDIIRTVIGGRPPFDETQVHSLCWESVNGVYKVAMMNRDALPHNYQWGIAVGRSAAVERFVSWPQEKRREIVQPRPTEQPRYYADPSRTPNDCSIVASKAYHELKDTSSWCQVISAGLILPSVGECRHSVVAFKYQKDGHVFIYDELGSLELDTPLEDGDAIKMAWQDKLTNLKVLMIVSDLHFVTH
jgi:hypothetical protein